MIADFPFLADLAIGVDRVVPQEGDNQVMIASTVLPSILPIYQSNCSNLTTDLTTTSKIGENGAVFINQAAQLTTCLTLLKGLYTLEVCLTARANFTTTVLLDRVQVQLSYQGFQISLAEMMLNTEAGTLNFSRYLLLTSSGILNVLVPPTNAIATNSIAFGIAFNVVRHI